MGKVQTIRQIDNDIFMYKLNRQKTIQCSFVLENIALLKEQNTELLAKCRQLSQDKNEIEQRLSKRYIDMVSKKDHTISKLSQKIMDMEKLIGGAKR